MKKQVTVIQEGRRITLRGRAAQIATMMVAQGEVSAAQCTPGLRLAAIVHSMRWKKALRIRSTLRPNATGDGQHAVYSFIDDVRIEADAGQLAG